MMSLLLLHMYLPLSLPPPVEAAVLTINKSLSDGSDPEDVLQMLQNEHISHFSVVPANAQYYADGLKERLRQKREKVHKP